MVHTYVHISRVLFPPLEFRGAKQLLASPGSLTAALRLVSFSSTATWADVFAFLMSKPPWGVEQWKQLDRHEKFEKVHSLHCQSPGCDVGSGRPYGRFLAHTLALSPFFSIILIMPLIRDVWSEWLCYTFESDLFVGLLLVALFHLSTNKTTL